MVNMKVKLWTVFALVCVITACGQREAALRESVVETGTGDGTAEAGMEDGTAAEETARKLNSRNGGFLEAIVSGKDYLEVICKYNGQTHNLEDDLRARVSIETRRLSEASGPGGLITRYVDTSKDQERVIRYRVVQDGDSGRMENNYWFMDGFIYITIRLEREEGEQKLHLVEGIASGGLCLQYDRERDQVLDGELTLCWQPEELDGLYEDGEFLKPEEAAACEDADQAVAAYKKFIESDEMYVFTATRAYPRGDSQAVYAIGDLNGDGMEDLWIDGGVGHSIYTLRGGELYRLNLEYQFTTYPTVIPLVDGGFLASMRLERPGEGQTSRYEEISQGEKKIPPEDAPFADAQKREGSADIYCYFRLDCDGSIISAESHRFKINFRKNGGESDSVEHIVCQEEGCEHTFGPYLNMLDPSRQLQREFVFQQEEWEYLDVADVPRGLGWGIPDEKVSEEWLAYQLILSGDFSLVENMSDRARLYSMYEDSQNEETGRSQWTYVLSDCNGDGVKELFVKFSKYDDMHTEYFLRGIYGEFSRFSYRDGVVHWEHSYGGHDISTYVPLKDGRVLLSYWGYGSFYGAVGRFDSELRFEQEGNTYHMRPGSDGEEASYFAYEKPEDGRRLGDGRSISMGEYYEWRGIIDQLLFQYREWASAGAFMPNRHREVFGVG